MIKLLSLDPNPVVFKGLKAFIKKKGLLKFTGYAKNEIEVYALLEQHEVDILIMDLELKKTSPVNLIKSLKRKYPLLKILIFSNHPVNMYALSLLKAGAIGYLSKSVPGAVFVSAIEQIQETGFLITSDVSNNININIDLSHPRNSYDRLSPREIEVLKFLIDGKRNVAIAEVMGLSPKTVNTYKTRLFSKLHVKNVMELFIQAKMLRLN
jgi:DNA-binding NarL/FixJ family response regulator